MLSDAMTMLYDALVDAVGVSITYSRRGLQSATLTASVGRTVFRLDDEFGPQREVTRDYLLPAADLVLDSVAVTPERGDRISETGPDGQTRVYEVLGPGGEPPWRYSDHYQVGLRIHTREVARHE